MEMARLVNRMHPTRAGGQEDMKYKSFIQELREASTRKPNSPHNSSSETKGTKAWLRLARFFLLQDDSLVCPDLVEFFHHFRQNGKPFVFPFHTIVASKIQQLGIRSEKHSAFFQPICQWNNAMVEKPKVHPYTSLDLDHFHNPAPSSRRCTFRERDAGSIVGTPSSAVKFGKEKIVLEGNPATRPFTEVVHHLQVSLLTCI
jgi:hypothetical protein